MTRTLTILTSVALVLVVGAGMPGYAAKENFDRSKPHISINSKSGSVDMSGFSAMDGLGIAIEVIEYQNGDDPILRKRPGRVKYSNITLERAYQGATDLRDWAEEAGRGKLRRDDFSVFLFDRSGAVLQSLNLLDCFPADWSLATDDRGVLTERITLVVERVEYTPG